MESFRRWIKGWLGKSLLGVVILLFAVAGAESLMVLATKPKPAAEVNGEEITYEELERNVESERQSLISRLGGQIDETLISAEQLRPRVLDGLIERKLLVQLAREQNMSVSDSAFKQWVVSMPQFQQDGQFSEVLFSSIVSQLGISPFEFAARARSDLVITQLHTALQESYFLSEYELRQLVELQEQLRSFRYAKLKAQDFIDQVSLSEDAIANYYKMHTYDYRTQEKAKVQYLHLKSEQYTKGLNITESEIEAAYVEETDQLKKDEQRQAAHILITMDALSESEAKEKAIAIRERIVAGESFADLAKEFSQDPGSAEQGGDLGFAGRGAYVKEFEEILFQLSEAQVSEPVKTEFGFHVIKLLKVRQPQIPTLEQERERLQRQLVQQKAIDVYHDKLEELKTSVYESGDLQEPAGVFGLQIQTSEWLSREAHQGSHQQPFTHPQVLQAVYSQEVLEEGFNSEVVELPDNNAVVVRLLEHSPAKLKPLNEVRGVVVQALQQEEASKLAYQTGLELIAKLKGGESIESENLKWVKKDKLKRVSMDAPKPVMKTVFSLPRSKEKGKASVEGVRLEKDFAIVQLLSVIEGEFGLEGQEKDNMKSFLARQLSQLEFQDYLALQKEQADIEINLN